MSDITAGLPKPKVTLIKATVDAVGNKTNYPRLVTKEVKP